MLEISKVLEEKSIKFIFTSGEHQGEKYVGTFSICDGPLCKCTEMTIQIALENNKHPYVFTVDVSTREIIERGDIEFHNLNFAKSFVQELNNDEWMHLYNIFYTAKLDMLKRTPISELAPDFPMETEIEKNSTMVAFDEIIPYNEPICVTLNDTEFILFDQYCIRSKCSCTSATIAFVPNIKDELERDNRVTTITIDYKRKRFKIEQLGNSSKEASEIAGKALEGSVLEKLKGRHEILKKLYENYRKKKYKKNSTNVISEYALTSNTVKDNNNLKKVGRNDPCPCGSGLKFKKCCLK